MDKSIDIVIARYKEENIDWILDIPKEFNIYIYNKGENLSKTFLDKLKSKFPTYKLENLKNVGRESDTYLNYIIKNYNNLQDLIIFCQAEPHIHSPDFSKLLENYKDFEDFQALTDRFRTDVNIPPKEYLEQENVKKKYLNGYRCAAVLFNLYDLLTISYKDIIYISMLNESLAELGILKKQKNKTIRELKDEIAQNPQAYKSPIKLFLEKCDITLKYNNGEFPAIYYYCLGACFGVKKHRILQNSLKSYQKMKDINLTHKVFGCLLERSWAIIFGPIYNKKILLEDLKISDLK